jgi:hypothetical protein
MLRISAGSSPVLPNQCGTVRVTTYRRASTDVGNQLYSLDAQSMRLDAYVPGQPGPDRDAHRYRAATDSTQAAPSGHQARRWTLVDLSRRRPVLVGADLGYLLKAEVVVQRSS